MSKSQKHDPNSPQLLLSVAFIHLLDYSLQVSMISLVHHEGQFKNAPVWLLSPYPIFAKFQIRLRRPDNKINGFLSLWEEPGAHDLPVAALSSNGMLFKTASPQVFRLSSQHHASTLPRRCRLGQGVCLIHLLS